MAKKREFSAEFKMAAVGLLLSKKMGCNEICALFDIPRQHLYRWKDEYLEKGINAFQTSSLVSANVVNKKAEKEKRELEEENEILKKVVAYFATKNVIS